MHSTFLNYLFWLIIILGGVFGFGYATGQPWAPKYGYLPLLVLIVILGIQVFGLPH